MAATKDFDRAGDSSQGEGSGSGPPVSADRMAYMADLLAELRAMARDDGHATLEGLLSLAHAEARRRTA